MPRYLRLSHGFTVAELLVLTGLLMGLMTIAVPNFLSWLPTLRLSSAARQVATDLQMVRMKAISQNTKFRLNFVTSTSYVVEKDNSGTFTTESGPFSLPEGITTATGATSEFQPRGTANAAGTITLSNGNEIKQVEIIVVGRVKIL